MITSTRLAYWNKALLYFSASGGFSPGHCSPSNDSIPWISETWTPENEPLFKNNLSTSTSISPPYMLYQPYQPNEAQVQAFRNKTNAFCEENNAVSRFSGGLGAYKGVAAHGFSVWSNSKALCQNDLKGRLSSSSSCAYYCAFVRHTTVPILALT